MKSIVLRVILLLAVCLSAPATARNLFEGIRNGAPKLVRIADGSLRGYESDGVQLFLGIPYAAPPVGDLRWKPPAPPATWKGVRDAGAFASSCVQTETYGVFAVPSRSEDCLYLNVFAPSTHRQPLPVMVWVHGGSLINGRTDDYDARKLARDGNVIVVSIAYRLNLFGYFAHPALDGEGHPFANYGTLDQQAALKWVRSNIGAFGGDSGNVTLFGESAGGVAILLNMVSPGASGLFHKVILESGVSSQPQTSRADAEKIGNDFGLAVGCKDQTAACLRSKTVDEIIQGADRFTRQAIRSVDGEILPMQMQEAIALGKFQQTPILMGNNLNEWRWFISLTELSTHQPVAADGYEKALTAALGAERAARVAAEFPLRNYESASVALGRCTDSRGFVCPSRRVMRSASKYVPVYVYEFVDTLTPNYFQPVSFPYAAAHTLELPYLFPNFHGASGTPQPLDLQRRLLSDRMVGYWTTFARTGNPDSPGLPAWPRWMPDHESTQLLGVPTIVTAKDSGIDRKCDFWDRL